MILTLSVFISIIYMFLVTNCVRQSGVMIPILFCIYLDRVLNLLTAVKIGRFISKDFNGCLAYADVIFVQAFMKFKLLLLRHFDHISIVEASGKTPFKACEQVDGNQNCSR